MEKTNIRMKLWDKGFKEDERIDEFTVGNDRVLDLQLAQYDIMGTIAHITMLESVGLLPKDDLDILLPELKALYAEAEAGRFLIEDGNLRCPFGSMSGFGELGQKIVAARDPERPFLSIEDLKQRAGIGDGAVKTLREQGSLDGLPETSQVDLFSLLA